MQYQPPHQQRHHRHLHYCSDVSGKTLHKFATQAFAIVALLVLRLSVKPVVSAIKPVSLSLQLFLSLSVVGERGLMGRKILLRGKGGLLLYVTEA